MRKDDVELVIRKVAGVEYVDQEVFIFATIFFVSGIEVHQGGGDGKGEFNFRGSIGLRVTGNDALPHVFDVVAVDRVPENQGFV